jgi:hypothetical protein
MGSRQDKGALSVQRAEPQSLRIMPRGMPMPLETGPRDEDCEGWFEDIECLGKQTHIVVLELANNGCVRALGGYCEPCANHVAERLRASLPPEPPEDAPAAS